MSKDDIANLIAGTPRRTPGSRTSPCDARRRSTAAEPLGLRPVAIEPSAKESYHQRPIKVSDVPAGALRYISVTPLAA